MDSNRRLQTLLKVIVQRKIIDSHGQARCPLGDTKLYAVMSGEKAFEAI